MAVYAFDFWGTLQGDKEVNETVRELARQLHNLGQEVHIVSAISPGLPLDSDEAYAKMLGELRVHFTKVHRVDHVPALKVEVLKRIGAARFWDDVPDYVNAARAAGIDAVLVGGGDT